MCNTNLAFLHIINVFAILLGIFFENKTGQSKEIAL